MHKTNTMREPTPDRRELTSDEIHQVSGGLIATMIWGSNAVSVSSDGIVLVSTNGGKSGTYSTF
jgi:hypothetical protein